MYDFLIDILHSLWRNGFSLTALGAVVFVILRQRKVKRKLQRLVPMLFSEDSEVKEYVQNQKVIIRNLKILFTFLGVEGEWNAGTSQSEKKDCRVRFTSLPKAGWLARYAGLFIPKQRIFQFRKEKMNMNKFKSRKFILAVVGAILIILNDGLDLGIDSNTVLAFAGLLATWIVGESAIDATRTAKGASYEPDYSKSAETGE